MLGHKTEVWAIEEGKFAEMQGRLATLRAWPNSEELSVYREAAAKRLSKVAGKVAVLALHGAVEQRISGMGFLFGGVGTEQVSQALESALANNAIDAIVLDVDSPGGTVPGVEELSDHIFSSRGKKPIIAVADSMAASAAYWIATAADHLVTTPGGVVGSVGVFAGHIDYSAALESEGIKVTLVKAGKYKAELSPYQSLTEDARDYLQDSVDETYDRFTKAVARNRGTTVSDVKANYGQGRVVSSDKAKAAGMVDRIATFAEVLGKLTGSASPAAAKAVSVEILRARHEHRKAVFNHYHRRIA